MNLLFRDAHLFVSNFNYQLASRCRDLAQLQSEDLLAGSADILQAIGYRFSYGLAPDETLLELAQAPFSRALATSRPCAAVLQHCYAESAVLPSSAGERDVGVRNRYFTGALLKELGISELPYFCSFASGCAGFVFLSIAAAGLLTSSGGEEVICGMADSMPAGVTYDLANERILGSAQSSAFTIGRHRSGYQLLGCAIYSSTRSLVPLLELVKRTVQMIKDLAGSLQIELTSANVLVHYPNMFPDAWWMVTKYLRLSDEQHVMRGLSERAHCFGSDSVMSLAEMYNSMEGRTHFVVNYGLGLHLGISALKEVAIAQ
ncbi:MAG: hypothetical protein JO354_13945 [Verrucomicrobia bacterium]|nr:hypothetical protein [Verrucomicrobiota bacterium]